MNFATALTAIAISQVSALKDIVSLDSTHLFGLRNGAVTFVQDAQIEACMVAFLDMQPASLKAGETLEVTDEMFQQFERETCDITDTLPNDKTYCRRYGAPRSHVAITTRLQSRYTGRELQVFCIGEGSTKEDALFIRNQNVSGFFKY